MTATDIDLITMLPVKRGIPRAVEAVVSLAALTAVAPLIAAAAVAVAVTSPGPAIFRQRRVGRHGRPFTLYKLRTMRQDNRGIGVTASDDERITAVGKFLRRTKLDELPALWNVFRGDMSLVGPRPEVPRYVDLDNALWQRVLEVRPGMTDPVTIRLRNEEELLAQVTGDRESFYLKTIQPLKLRGYLAYLSKRSWWSDVKMISLTCLVVLLRAKAPALSLKGISAHSHAARDFADL
jgi:lipopolysaccharide/colanic/teichoic acid biosynthesis glycosyltransferase